MRPERLEEFVGQGHLLGPGKLLRRLIEADRVGSMVFFGPPGTGKTSLARLIAGATRRHFEQLNAVLHGVKELREVLTAARDRLATGGGGTLLFIDEIHRFSRTQQDALLADVEEGMVALIGATTGNPFFSLSPALVSRGHLMEFQPLAESDLVALLQRAIADPVRGLGRFRIDVQPGALEWLASVSDGDARRVLAILETAVLSSSPPVALSTDLLRESMATRAQRYDVTGDEHYDTASAIIKSIRGSDPDAAIYWLARMLEGGEDVRFICRRLVILASEDVGNADPAALPMAVACFQACEQVGLPECQFALAQTVLYLAIAPKSNSATTAIGAARRDVREQAVLPVPRHLRDGHSAGNRSLGRGQGYQYSHESAGGVAAQEYLGVDREYWHPVDRGSEADFARRLAELRRLLKGQP
jgi:putative ATPase